uniref:Uncharacterized protein n=1 Tax=mine drainage metagenome TaxID=410659 RepID=E6Q164_9ZZZZ
MLREPACKARGRAKAPAQGLAPFGGSTALPGGLKPEWPTFGPPTLCDRRHQDTTGDRDFPRKMRDGVVLSWTMFYQGHDFNPHQRLQPRVFERGARSLHPFLKAVRSSQMYERT